jgi:hypothetical protein
MALGLDETFDAPGTKQSGLLLSALVHPVPLSSTVQSPKFGVPHLAVGIWIATAFVLLAGPKKVGARDLISAYGVVMPMFGWVG